MILRVYAVYDEAVGAFMQPFMCRSDAEAQRIFLASVANNETFQRNYKDYGLFFLAEFNDVTGEYGVASEEKLAVPRLIINGFSARSIVDKQVPLPFASPTSVAPVGELPADGSGC